MTDLGFQGTIDFGGQGRFTVELVRALAPYCDEITVYPTAVSVEEPSEHLWWRDMPSNVSLAEKRGLVDGAIRDANSFATHDVVHVNYASLGAPALVSKRLGGTPFVYTVHGHGPAREMVRETTAAVKWWTDNMLLPVVARRGAFVTVSNFNRDLLKRRGLDPAVIYLGVRRERFRDADPTGIRADYGIDPDTAVLLFVGRFLKYKDVRTLVRAFSHVSRAYEDDVELVLAGGRFDGLVRRHTGERDVRESVTVISDVTDDVIKRLAGSATAFVSTSYREGFGLVFLEAMASGLPIVHVDAGAAPEVVGNAGVSVPPRDPKTFARAVLSVLREDDLRDRLRRNCRERVERFTWEAAAREYVTLYRRTTDGSADGSV